MTNGRQKGSSAERQVCKMLREWWGGTFQRRSLGMPGDDLIGPPNFGWSVEVKHVKALKVKHLFWPTAQLRSFWMQCLNQASKLGKAPALFCKIEGSWYVVTFNDQLRIGRPGLRTNWSVSHPGWSTTEVHVWLVDDWMDAHK